MHLFPHLIFPRNSANFLLQVEVVTDEDPPEVMETLEEGSFFGERNLVFTSPRGESSRAVTHVDMLVLTKEDLDCVLSHYEELADHVLKVANGLYPEMAAKSNVC